MNLNEQLYSICVGHVVQGLQTMEEKRVLKVKEYITAQAAIHKDVIPIVNVCIEGMSRAATLVDPQQVRRRRRRPSHRLAMIIMMESYKNQ